MKNYGLIGNNIGYSLSPGIHGLIYKFFNLSDHVYTLCDIHEEQLLKGFQAFKMNYCGFNVTVPYKIFIGKLIDRNLSPVSAVNAIVSKNGETFGYNTDIDGFRHHIRSRNITVKNVGTLIIGAGGAAEAVAYALISMENAPQILSRTVQKSENLQNKYRLSAYSRDFSPKIIVNASGKNLLREGILSNIDTHNLETILDISYNFSDLRLAFENQGIAYIDGFDMLIYQAIYAAKLLYGVDIDGRIEELYHYIKEYLVSGGTFKL